VSTLISNYEHIIKHGKPDAEKSKREATYCVCSNISDFYPISRNAARTVGLRGGEALPFKTTVEKLDGDE